MTRIKTILFALALTSSAAAATASAAFADVAETNSQTPPALTLLTPANFTGDTAHKEPVSVSHRRHHRHRKVCWRHRHHWHCWR